MKKEVLVERGKDGFYWLTCKVGQSFITANGQTLEAAKEDFKDAYEDMIGAAFNENDFDYKYDTACALQELDFINMTEFAKIIGINASLLRQYKKGQYISKAQATRIQDGIHRIGERLLAYTII